MSNIIGKLTGAAQTSGWFLWEGGLCTLWLGIQDTDASTPHFDFGGNTVSLECADAAVEAAARPLALSGGSQVEATSNAVFNVSIGPCYLRFKTAGGGPCDVGVKASPLSKKR